MAFSAEELRDLPDIISAPRFATYLNSAGGNTGLALTLYRWNLHISAAFLIPLQVCEVAARNGVIVALEARYGANWHLSPGFKQSLPRAHRGYSPYDDFEGTSGRLQLRGQLTAGKIVADLKFAFWENMLTARHDRRLWVPFYSQAFPHTAPAMPVYQARGTLNSHLETIRRLRNRIAHHEPIFSRNLQQDLDKAIELISWRCGTSAAWVQAEQSVTTLLAAKPIP